MTTLAHPVGAVPACAPGDTAGEVRGAMTGRAYACADDVAVLSDDRLAGLLPIERLLAASPGAVIAELMDANPPVVAPGSDQEAIAWEMVRRGESSVAVVDARGRFLGLVPPHRMIGALLAEHDEDMAQIGGYLASTKRSRQAVEEPVGRRLWHRLPWLVVGLLGAMLSSVLLAAFERDLETNVLLAIFIPAVVYMADAVGTQTEALLIRGLSAGVNLRLILRREAATGLVIGLAVGGTFLPFVLLGWGDAEVAAAVAIALAAACAVATMVAMALPWLLYRLGRDPAFGAGPLATVIQDLLSILVYVGAASLIVT